jgi:hypothetical protein
MTQTPEQRAAASEAARLMLYYRLTPEMVLAIEDYQRRHGMSILMGTSTMSTGTEHDHTTGLIRGRMDFRLNRALGMVEAFTSKLTDGDLRGLGVTNKDAATSEVLHLMSEYMMRRPAVQAIGAVYGLIGKAKRKRKMVYGSPEGPMKPIITKKRIKREKTSAV